MNIVDYHIFINLLVNNIKNNFSQTYTTGFSFYSSQDGYFAQIFLLCYKKLGFFVQKFNRRLFYTIKNKKRNKPTKPTKKSYKKDRERTTEIFMKMRKLKKEIMLTIEINICKTKTEKEKNK